MGAESPGSPDDKHRDEGRKETGFAAPSPAEVAAHVERLAESSVFAGSDRLVELLRFLVHETLRGNATGLKESAIGNAVYRRAPPYDPRIDSTVRVEARRLRNKLKDYYASVGCEDAILVHLPTGSYVPEFSRRTRPGHGAHGSPGAGSEPIFEQGFGSVIAIMPVRSLSNHPDSDSFADGLTDELMYAVAQSPGLRVASRSTVFQYKNRPYSVPGLAQELGADSILQGTVRWEADVIRVTIELVDPAGLIVWTERFDAGLDQQFVLQERLAASLLSRLRFDSSPMRAGTVRPGRTALRMMGRVLQARASLDRQTPAGLQEAKRIFQEVAHQAPDYARGPAGIGDCWCDEYRLGLIDHSTAMAAGLSAVAKALEIDPLSIEAHAASATLAAWLERDTEKAETHFQRALELGANARASRIYAVFLTIIGRHDEAERLFEDAREIEPFSAQQEIAEALSRYQARRFELVKPFERMRRKRGVSVEPVVFEALARVFRGEHAEASALIPVIVAETAQLPDFVHMPEEIAAWLGSPGRARQALASPSTAASAFARATLAAAVGAEDACCAALEESVRRKELSAVWIRSDPRFDRFRESARFAALSESLGGGR